MGEATTTISHELIAEIPAFEGRLGESITASELYEARADAKKKSTKNGKAAETTTQPAPRGSAAKRVASARGNGKKNGK